MSEKRKERSDWVHATTAGKVDEINIVVDHVRGELSFVEPVTDTYVESSYERAKGPKIVSHIPQSRQSMQLDPDVALWKAFDILYAVDTNTAGVEPRRISVTVGHRCQRVIHLPDSSWSFIEEYPYCFEMHNVSRDFNPEVVGWVEVIRQILRSDDNDGHNRIGVIVDSELGLHDGINSRSTPLYGRLFLPNRFTLVYASSDTSRDRAPNKLISNADKVSKMILGRLCSGELPLGKQVVVCHPFQRFRRIRLARADPAS